MPHVNPLPIIEPFTALIATNNLIFTDQRSDSSVMTSNAFNAWCQEMGSIFNRLGVGLNDIVCRPNNEQMEIDMAAFYIALDANPGLDFAEWQETRPLHREHDPDPSKHDYFFCVRDSVTNECVGGLALVNIEIESDTATGIVCGGMILPGIITDNSVGAQTTPGYGLFGLSAIYTHILTTQFMLEDGRTLDFTDQHFLPNFQSEEIVGLREAFVADQPTIDMLAFMSIDFDVEGDLADLSQTIHIKRRLV
jgi:hypothetical protein